MSFRNSVAAATAAIALSAAGAAQAGACPEGQVLDSPRELKQAPNIGVDASVLGSIDLTGWRDMGAFRLRLRKLTIAPGGVVPTHSHGDRPSIVYIVSGEILEHNALCAVPILHKADEATEESGPGHVHWWENVSDAPVVVLSTDVIPFKPKQ